MNSAVRLGVSPTTATPTDFYSQRFLGFLFLHWNPGLCGLSHSPVISPSLSVCKYGTVSHCFTHPVLQPPLCCVSSLPQVPISAPPTCLDECFSFNSLVIGLPYSLISWQVWLCFIFKFIVVLLLVV